ncbi:MAG TPA: recombinase family protein, partial [Bryobacteraceae bacterium]|nr:recombinase family protein [Bryobacteraceae bacterium]
MDPGRDAPSLAGKEWCCVCADAVKKKLEINPVEAEIVQEVFALCRSGKGIRGIADHLNRKGLTYRRKDRKWTSGLVHQLLTREAYAGTHYFNRTDVRLNRNKDKSEWVPFPTPVIIDHEAFHAVPSRDLPPLPAPG